MRMRFGSMLALGLIAGALALAAPGKALAALRVCSDPGNMPLSNNRGEGIENKIADVLARALGTTVEYYYRPAIERGMTRTTLYADQCDVMLDMPSDSEGVITTTPVYRTTFVLASRSDRNIHIKNLDDPRLKTLKIGVYQTSAIRQALAEHGVNGNNVVIHYLSHDADLVPEHQPGHQVQQVIDGQLDIAAVWGPFAGYYKAVKHAPLTIQPVNLMEDDVPLQFDMAIALRRTDGELRQRLDQALREQRDAIRSILIDFGVPLVSCDTCIVSGDLPAHGPYAPVAPTRPSVNGKPVVTIATLNDWLAHGANVNVEFNNAVLADDKVRAAYLLEKKHAAIDGLDLQGETPLHHAITMNSPSMVKFLIDHGADVNQRDRDGWTALMTAAWVDDAEDAKLLLAHKADPDAASPQNFTPLGIALQYGKNAAARVLIESGADVNRPIGDAGYTPLMLAVAGRADDAAQELIRKGADLNARNGGGVTALMIAAAADQPNMVSLLLRSGANVAAQNDRGDTALSIARARGHQDVIKLLDEQRMPATESSGHTGA